MVITRKQLIEKSACREALAFFDEACPGGKTADFEWNPAAQGWLLACRETRGWFGWLTAKGVLPEWSMYGANLRGANLRGANLRGADLYGANLYGAEWDSSTTWPAGFNAKEVR